MTGDPPGFTAGGDARLEASLAEVLGVARSSSARIPGVTALLLGGSLGRGEGSVRHTAGGDVLSSDIELYLVGSSPDLRRDARALQRELSAASGIDVSVAWADPRALRAGRSKNRSWRPVPTIRHYELAATARVVAGTRPAMLPIDPASLPLAEGVRLILNRLAEAGPVFGRTRWRPGDPSPDEGDAAALAAMRWADKILISCGDTVLLAAHRYVASYRDRQATLRSVSESWPMPAGWREMVLDAYERKLTDGAGSPPGELAAVLHATLAAALRDAAGIGLEPLATLPGRLAAAARRRPGLLRYLPPVGPAAHYEAAVVAIRARGAGRRLSARALADALRGRPLSLASQGIGAWLFFAILAGDEAAAAGIGRALVGCGVPAADVQAAADLDGLATLNARYWAATS